MTTMERPASAAASPSATVVFPEPVPPAMPSTNMPGDYTTQVSATFQRGIETHRKRR